MASPLAALGLLVSPTQLGLVGKPGQIVSGTLHVSSSKSEENHISLAISDFTRNEDGQVVEILDSKLQPRSCKGWIDVDRSDFVSPAVGSVDVTVSARIPADATGSYWALVALASQPPARDLRGQGVAIRLIPRVAIPIVVTVEGTTKPAVAIIETRAVRADKGVDVYSTIENTGNTAVLISAAFSLERRSTGGGEAEELAGTTVGPLTSLPGTRMKAKGHLEYDGSLAGVQAHAYLRYGPDAADSTEAVAVIEDRPPVRQDSAVNGTSPSAAHPVKR